MTYNFDKVHTVKDLTISIIILGLGAGLYFLNGGLGIALLIAGIISIWYSINPVTGTL